MGFCRRDRGGFLRGGGSAGGGGQTQCDSVWRSLMAYDPEECAQGRARRLAVLAAARRTQRHLAARRARLRAEARSLGA
eukprot:Skav214748  [mRNA]  locus=scaffold983:146975:147211:- [translate_table: standard]